LSLRTLTTGEKDSKQFKFRRDQPVPIIDQKKPVVNVLV